MRQRRAARNAASPPHAGSGIHVDEGLVAESADTEVQGGPVVDMQTPGGSVTTTVPPAGT